MFVFFHDPLPQNKVLTLLYQRLPLLVLLLHQRLPLLVLPLPFFLLYANKAASLQLVIPACQNLTAPPPKLTPPKYDVQHF